MVEMLSVVTCAKQGGRFIPNDELTALKLEEPSTWTAPCA